jgi:hypothetical protein
MDVVVRTWGLTLLLMWSTAARQATTQQATTQQATAQH